MRNFSLTVAITVVLCACETPHPKAGGSFEYEVPAFMTRLTMPNFDYVRFAVTGEAAMEPIRKKMFREEQIGLVNKALKQILVQLPPDGGAYGLVNVVSDTSIIKVYRGVQDNNGVRENLERVSPNLLVLRADIVKFRQVNMEKYMEKEFEKSLSGAGIHVITRDSLAALASRLADDLEAQQASLHAHADHVTRQAL